MIHSLRARLTLWYTAVLAVVLIAFSAFSYALLSRAIRTATDESISATAREFAAAFSRDRSAISSREFRYRDREIIAFSPDGRLIAASSTILAPADRQRVLENARGRGFVTIDGGPEGDGIRVLRYPVSIDGGQYLVAVAQDLDPQADRLEAAAHAVLLGIPLALLIAAGGGYLLARKSLAPVAAMSEKAREIGAATLNERIAVADDRDELGHLATTLNDLLERLQRAFESQRTFMADASHELRTPISIILGESDVALSRPERSRIEYRESIRIVHRAAQKLTRIVQNVFLLARTDAGTYPMLKRPLYLDDVIAECVQGLRTVAGAKHIEIANVAEPDLAVSADEELLQALIQNLVENAVKFTPDHGRVDVSAIRSGDAYVVRITDSGPGIAASDQPFIFDRFYRGKVGSPGAGLGLAIARWAAEAHGAVLILERSDANGSTFRITFPATERAGERLARIAEGEK
jgi:two-component system OmpR family sensor kinase